MIAKKIFPYGDNYEKIPFRSFVCFTLFDLEHGANADSDANRR